jgi:hypothetical protein
MSKIGEWLTCPVCHKRVHVIEIIPDGNNWINRKFSCKHSSRLWNPEPLTEMIEIKDEVLATSIDRKYGQVYTDKTKNDSRSIPCKTCGHTGTQHKFLKGYDGKHNCYLCNCLDYDP